MVADVIAGGLGDFLGWVLAGLGSGILAVAGYAIKQTYRNQQRINDLETETRIGDDPTRLDADEVPHSPDVDPGGGDTDETDLPERNVGDDPLKWLPGEFVDQIDGSPAINRKGFEVLSHFYEVDVDATLQVAPEDTGHEYARVKAEAEIDGRTVEAFGSAHVDRGDDSYLLLEMAGTRARKRALSIATGAGAVAVEELKNEPEGNQ